MNNYKISILMIFMLSVVCISCSLSDDEETEEDDDIHYEESEKDKNTIIIDDEEEEADDGIDYEEDEAADNGIDYEEGETADDEDYNEEGEEDDKLDDEEIGEGHNTIIIDDDEEKENEDEHYDKEGEEDNENDNEQEDDDDDEMVDYAQYYTPKKKRRGGYPPHVVFSKEVQTCCIEIVEYFPKGTMRENVTYAMENYVQEVDLPPYANNYYKLMANNLLRGEIPLIGVFCKERAEEILEPKKDKMPTRRFNALRMKQSTKCKKLLGSKFGGPAKPLLHNAIHVITTAHVEEIDNVFLTDFWDLVIHRFKLKTAGKGCMRSPAAFCISVYQKQRKKSFFGSASSDTDDI